MTIVYSNHFYVKNKYYITNNLYILQVILKVIINQK